MARAKTSSDLVDIRVTHLDRILARPGETLTAHTLQVLERVEGLARLRPLPEYPRLWERLRRAALLHDSGKLARGFQRGLRSRKNRWGLRHEVLSLAFTDWLVLAEDDRPWVMAAIATHHRDARWILDRYRPRADGDRTVELIEEISPETAEAWYEWLGTQGAPMNPFTLPTAEAIRRALKALREWIDPLIEEGPQHPCFTEAILLRGFMVQADHAGAAGIGDSTAVRLQAQALTETPGRRWYPHQLACAQQQRASTLLVAPTGAGKTEAALLWANRPGLPRLFYMLPFRASMDAMAQRLRAFSDQVGLQHGRALISLYRLALREGRTEAEAMVETQARMNLARLYAYPVKVFSPYHLLRAVYQLKGFEALLADCYDSAIVVDEIHAYDPERLALILGTLRLLQRHFQARLLVMTATLPPVVREALDETLPGLEKIQADRTTFSQFRRHRIVIAPGEVKNALDTIGAEHRAGKAVLVVANTVRRARDISATLREMGHDVLTLHGRFCGRDRWALEQELGRLFGRTGQAGDRPIVVATQVIEVSLDLDFDTLYSDPAPLDALIQRFGRVNRTLRIRDLAPVHVFTEPTGADDRHPIYDPALVSASLAVLSAHDGEPVDEAGLSEWLADAYRDAEGWRKRFLERQAEFQRVVLDDLHAFESADDGLALAFMRLFDEVHILPLDLEDAYRAAPNPAEAEALLVSLSYWQYGMLERQARAWRGEGEEEELFFTSATYDPENGLELENDEEM